ncbi:reverse transcriptase domain-containing protein [Tanacetum coccineum]
MLNGSNFLDWYRNLRIVLRNEQKLHHLEEALPEAPPATATAVVHNAYTHRVAEQQELAYLILAEQELFETVKAFHACKQEEGQYVSTYMLKMKAYLDQMECLGYPMPLVLRVNMILTSLSKDYDQFMQNYNMHGMGGKGKSKLAYDPKHIIPSPAKKEHPELKKNKASASGTSGNFTIELFSFPKSNTEIYDTGYGTHICNTIQGFKGYRKLNKGALDLYVGNGHSAAVEAIGIYELILPSGMILVLDNFSKDNICYFNAFPRDGIFEIDMHNHISNERSIYTCSNKKTKHNLDSTFLWYCRLGHINKKYIKKLQHDGLLESIDEESFDVCVSCLSGKMATKHFTHASERASDLLGIIHSDVCGPFRTTSKEGANYYITFTDDFSRYGYVYLIKHTHKVFEMFKTFQNEVENQLRKTIKSLRSDRGGNLSTLPMSFWGYTLESDARILNMVQTKKKMALKGATRSTPVTTTPAPTATTTTTVTNAQLPAMIDQGVSAVLAARDATRNGIDSHTSGMGVRGSERVARECTYQDFMKCKPLYFKGTEGVVELTQWFERMETVFRISNCSVENQVKFSTCTLLASALTWWNSHVMTVTHDVAYSMTWVDLRKKMTDKYCPRNEMKKLEAELWNLKVIGTDVVKYNQRFQELALLCVRMFPEESDKIERYVGGLPDMIHGNIVASKPKTMQEAIEMATELMDKRVSTMAERQAENKRKFENTSRNNQNQQQQQNKRQNTGRAYTAGSGDKKPYGGSRPLCSKCNYHHDGPCAPKCYKCNKYGHIARDCRGTGNANNINNQKGTGSGQKPTCFECGVQGHFQKECPRLKNNKGNRGNQAGNDRAPAKVYVVGNAGANHFLA